MNCGENRRITPGVYNEEEEERWEGYSVGPAGIDMQHGAYGLDNAMQAVSAVVLAGKPAIVRVPVGEYSLVQGAGVKFQKKLQKS